MARTVQWQSTWRGPRPVDLKRSRRRVRVELAGQVLAETDRPMIVLERDHAPVFYVPATHVRAGILVRTDRTHDCSRKGVGHYFDLKLDDLVTPDAAIQYLEPKPEYPELRDHIAFDPGKVECYVDGYRVETDGEGGWIVEDH